MKLSAKGVRYSPTEQKAFSFLSTKPKTTIELSDAIYTKTTRPFNDRGVVLSVMKKLTNKVHANREPFIIRSTERRGPYPVSFWVERVK